VLEQHLQNAERLFLQANSLALLAQFAGTQIRLEDPKSEPTANLLVVRHGGVSLQSRESTTGRDDIETAGRGERSLSH
jgi:hypothetical protein